MRPRNDRVTSSERIDSGGRRRVPAPCFLAGCIVLWAALVPGASAQTPCTTDCPDPDFNRVDTSGSIQLPDCFESSDQSNVAEPGNGCQSYAGNLFESLDPVAAGFCDSNILNIWLGADSDFFYVEFEGTGSWDCDNVGSAHQFNVEFDVDRLTESPGPRGDYVFQYQAIPEHVCPDNGTACSLAGSWNVADEGGDGTITGFTDESPDDPIPNDVGGPNPTASDFDCGSACSGYSGDFKTTNGTFARVLTRESKRVVQFAIRKTELTGQPVAIRYTTVQSSTFSPTDFLFHDEFESSTLPTHSFDTCCEEGVTPAIVSSVRALSAPGGVVVEWETAGEIGPVDFDLYRLDAASDRWVEVTRTVVPAVRQTPGGVYRVHDDGAAPGQSLTYKLAELEEGVLRREHGPYTVEPEWTEEARSWAGDEPYSAELRLPPERQLKRMAASREAESVNGRSRAVASVTEPAGVKLYLEESGLYLLTADEIAVISGLEIGHVKKAIRSGHLRVTRSGEQVAYQALADGARLLFFGEAPQSVYTRESAYFFGLGGGAKMQVARGHGPPAVGGEPTFLDTVHFEIDLLPRTYLASGPDDDYWFQDIVISGDPTYGTSTSTIQVSGLPQAAEDATLTVNLRGSRGSKSVQVSVNGTLIGTTQWSTTAEHRADLEVPDGLLLEGANTVELTGLAGQFMVDSFDLSYMRTFRAEGDQLVFRGDGHSVVTVSGFSVEPVIVFDITHPKRPIWRRDVTAEPDPAGGYRVSLAPDGSRAQYLALAPPALLAGTVRADRPSDLRSTSNRADYLAVTASSLLDATRELAQYRAQQGLTPMVVDLEDIMDEFADGTFEPTALARFLAYAAREWSGPPRFVVLVGTGHFDYRDNLGLGANPLPPLMVKTVTDLAPSDGDLVDFDEDGAPDLPIGRIPALVAQDVTDYLAKIEAYESSPGGGWMDKVSLLADDRDPLAGNFPLDSDRLADHLPGWISAEKIYLGAPYTLAQARQQLLASWNEGARLTNFVGHGGFDRLAGDGLLTTADVATLTNGSRSPVVTALTCLIAHFGFPGFASLGEELTLHATGGAVAVLGPTHISYNSDSTTLGGHLMDAIVPAVSSTLGDALQEAYRGFVSSEQMNNDPAVLRVFVLLGDPALRLP